MLLHPAHLALDVSTDNEKAIGFYKRMGLQITKIYISGQPPVEFVTFESAVASKEQSFVKTAAIEEDQLSEGSTVGSIAAPEESQEQTKQSSSMSE